MQRHAPYFILHDKYIMQVPHIKSFTGTASVVQCACESAFVSMDAESNQGPDLDSGIRFFYQKLYYMYIVRSACKLRARRTEYKSVFFHTT
jgi:hypothetical protein